MPWLALRLSYMAKSKQSVTGNGYLGEIMVHKISRAVGVVEKIVEAQAGWPPEVTLKSKTGLVKKGKLSEFREASGEEKKKYSSS